MVKKFNRDVREYKRAAFDDVAVLYDQARPGYPEQLYKDLIELSKIPSSGKILEIGAGTGQATIPLAEMGYTITAIELGSSLAQVARDKLKNYPKVTITTGSFEDWELSSNELFDLVIAATAFHWIDPIIRLKKSAAVLKPGGAIGVFGSWHTKDDESEFLKATRAIYNHYLPPKESYEELLAIIPTSDELEASGLFVSPVVRTYDWTTDYTTKEYIKLIGTYSNHMRLPDAQRNGLFRELTDLIDNDFGGHITKQYATELVVAFKSK